MHSFLNYGGVQQAVELCIDSEAVVNTFKGDKTCTVVGWRLIQKIKSLLESD